MSTPQEAIWVKELNRARNDQARTARVPQTKEKILVQRDMNNAKKALRLACQNNNKDEILTWLRRLISLRAEQTAILISEIQHVYGSATDEIIERLSTRYGQDCLRLIQSVYTITKKDA